MRTHMYYMYKWFRAQKHKYAHVMDGPPREIEKSISFAYHLDSNLTKHLICHEFFCHEVLQSSNLTSYITQTVKFP